MGELRALRSTAPADFDAAVHDAAPAVPFETGRPWHNDQATQSFTPARTYRPGTLPQVRAIVDEAMRGHVRVRAFGTGHSYSDVAVVFRHAIESFVAPFARH